jgi:hypothetical protein
VFSLVRAKIEAEIAEHAEIDRSSALGVLGDPPALVKLGTSFGAASP